MEMSHLGVITGSRKSEKNWYKLFLFVLEKVPVAKISSLRAAAAFVSLSVLVWGAWVNEETQFCPQWGLDVISANLNTGTPWHPLGIPGGCSSTGPALSERENLSLEREAWCQVRVGPQGGNEALTVGTTFLAKTLSNSDKFYFNVTLKIIKVDAKIHD